MTIYLDLDGTLIDTRLRHCAAHAEAARRYGGKPLTPDHYWACRRQGISEAHIALLADPDLDADAYQAMRKSLLETPDMLARDIPAHGAVEALARWHAAGHRLVVATMRRDVAALEEQLARLQMAPHLDRILARGHGPGGWSVKRDLISADLAENPGQAIMIGDSEGDLLAGKACNLPTYGLTTGSRTPARLALYSPTGLLNSLDEVDGVL